jgi:hypothetical protein
LTLGIRYGPVADRPTAFTTLAPYSAEAPASQCRVCSSATISPLFFTPILTRATTPRRCDVFMNSCSRVQCSRTGRPFIAIASTAPMISIETPALPPKPPPT